ncbi:hypothetical protein [Streptomyces sp900116325]|uniref:hypothetical protein n=1 Tax=Streptomyces sp. 900116325 TaxID=3154295 RepID=UPI0033B792DB
MLHLDDSGKFPIQVILRSYVANGQSINAQAMGVHAIPPAASPTGATPATSAPAAASRCRNRARARQHLCR